MERIKFKINDKQYDVGNDVDSELTLLDFIRRKANLLGTKYMCLEGGCGACIVSVIKNPGSEPVAVNACLVLILSCHNWEITTIEKLGNRLIGYHPIQKTLAKYNGTQCGYCSPGWVMSMYSLLENNSDLKMAEIERSFASNICRCTGYRSILDAFKTFGKDAPKSDIIDDIEDLKICKKLNKVCKAKCEEDDWCIITKEEVENVKIPDIILKDGKHWYKARTIQDIFNIWQTKGDDSYMLVAGNTAKGVYPIKEYPNLLIDISNVSELKGYTIDQNLIIRAGTTLTELTTILERFSQEDYFGYLKVLNDHLNLVAHVAVKNLGTIAGNLIIKHQHNEFPSDIYLLLETIGAYVTIVHRHQGKQVLTMEQFLRTNMRGKVIVNVMLPPFNDEYKIVTFKIMPRAQNAKAIVNAGFLYKYTNANKVLVCRIVFGGLSALFNRARATEAFLVGKMLFTNETLQWALKILESELVVRDMLPEPSAAYRKQLSMALFYKGLLILCPVASIHPRLRSGAVKLNETRPLSQGQQMYETKPSLYPLNQPIPKVEALIQSAGEASFTEDLPSYSHEVFAALVLSTVPTGKIVSIDPSAALGEPGAIAFYSVNDIPGLNSFTPEDDPFGRINEEVFSSGQIQYFGQPIGVVVADTNHTAVKISKMVNVIYSDVTKPVIDINEAKTDPERTSLFDKIDATSKENDIRSIIEGSFTLRGQYHFTMETVICVTRPNEEGLNIHATSQWPDGVQKMVSRALNIQQNRIDVHVRRLGGGFGIKITRTILAAVACSLVSIKLNKPCRLIMPLTSVTEAFGKRFPCSSKFDLGVNSQGVIQYLNLNLYEDNGFDINEQLQLFAIKHYANCYDASRWNYKNFSVQTDTAKNTWFRAPGSLETIATIEGIMEKISYTLSMDPIEVRSGNLDPTTSSNILEIVNSLKKSSQYNTRRQDVIKFNIENRWKKRGLRVALLKWIADGPRIFEVNLAVFEGDGTIVVTHGGIEMGQGINTKVAQVCAFLLKVPLGLIQIKANNTTIAPNCTVTGGSVTSQYTCIGARICCEEMLRRLRPIREKMNNPTWQELIKEAFRMNVDLQVHGYAGLDKEQIYNLYGMTIAEVEVDILTGERQILRVVILQDVGQSISPKIDIGQVEGAFVMGLGYWLMEKLIYDQNNGKLLTNRTWNYHVPQALDIPQDFRVSFRRNSYSTELIFGSKAVGEPPICMTIAVPFAIREAVTSARLDSGIPSTSWFDIDGAYTLDKVCMAAGTKYSDFLFY